MNGRIKTTTSSMVVCAQYTLLRSDSNAHTHLFIHAISPHSLLSRSIPAITVSERVVRRAYRRVSAASKAAASSLRGEGGA